MQTNLQDINEKMRKIDLCMMTTINEDGLPASRPMSSNGEVDESGHSYFFTTEDTQLAKDLVQNPNINLAFAKKQTFISVAGQAKLVHSRRMMEEHWSKDLEVWFENGLDTPGIVMIDVAAKHIKMWEKGEEREALLL